MKTGTDYAEYTVDGSKQGNISQGTATNGTSHGLVTTGLNWIHGKGI